VSHKTGVSTVFEGNFR